MIRAGKDFQANLSTGKWDVVVSDNMGLAIERPALIIPPVKVVSAEYMATCIHEVLHASLKEMSESEVDRVSRDVTEVLWKRGYRLEHRRHTKG